MHEALDVLQRAEHAPDSPMSAFQTAEMRRTLRREAKRLREHQLEPRYKNLHNAEELADIYERTVRRDEIIEKGMRDFHRITLNLGRIVNDNGLAVEKRIAALVMEAERAAEEHGPGSEAAQRYRLLQMLGWLGQQGHDHRRKPGAPFPWKVSLARDPSVAARFERIAAESLDSLPPGEPVIAIPPDGRNSGGGRVFLRIGLGEASWVGSFERGHASGTTVYLMPDGEHLWVSAEGAGYILEMKSRTLVEKVGTEVVGVFRDEAMTVFVVDHDGMSLEAFGRSGRLWKTDRFGCGEFRRLGITDTSIIGETRQPFPPWWACFSVKLDTGEVLSTMRFEEEGDRCCQGVDLLQRGRTGSSGPPA